MTPLTTEHSATQFVDGLNDALTYLEAGIVGGSTSSLRHMTTEVSAPQFVENLMYNLNYLKNNILGSSVTLRTLTENVGAPQFVTDLNYDLNLLEENIGGGGSETSTVYMQLQGGKIATTTSSATTIDGNNVVGYPCASTNDDEFFNNCHTRLMLDIGWSALSGVSVQSGEQLTIFCYNASGSYLGHVNAVGNILSGTRFVKFMVSKSSRYTSLRRLAVSVQGNATQVKNVTPTLVNTSYFSFDTEYPSMDASGNIIYTGANSGSRYYDNGLIKLPPNYSTTGEAVPLVVFVHGTNGFDFYKGPKTVDGSPMYKVQQDFVVNNGYAMCDCSGITNVGKYLLTNAGSYDNTYWSPSFVTCLHSLVEFITANYNVKDDGVYLISKSAGGYTLHLLTQMNILTIKKAASLAPAISPFGTMQSYTTSANRATKRALAQLGITINSTEWDVNKPIILDNIHKIRQIDPLFVGDSFTDDDVNSLVRVLYYRKSATKKYFYNCTDCINGVTINESMSSGTGLPVGTVVPALNDIGINVPVPTKIWIEENDDSVSYNEAKFFSQIVKRGGSDCQLISIKQGHGAHHAVDTAENAPKETYKPKYADEVTVAKTYVQIVKWFEGLAESFDDWIK